jgi:DNA-binding transcriptional LysR family regulator
MDTLTGIKVFRQIVESGSFVAAANRLEMSTAMVSKHVKQVEQRLGVRLLNRNTRTLSLTEPGRVYFERSKTILDDLEETELELASLTSAPRGNLRITLPSWFAGQGVADMFAQYRQRYPQIVLDVSFEDRLVDLVEEGYDLAVRVTRNTLPPGLIARPVRSLAFFIAGSREYLERNGTPKSPEDLANHDRVALDNSDSWVLTGPRGPIEVPARVVLRYRSMAGLANAVAAGIGLAPLSAFYFDDPVFKNVLTPVLPEYPVSEPTVYLVYVSRKYVPLKIRTFIEFWREHFAQSRSPDVCAIKGPAADSNLRRALCTASPD